MPDHEEAYEITWVNERTYYSYVNSFENKSGTWLDCIFWHKKKVYQIAVFQGSFLLYLHGTCLNRSPEPFTILDALALIESKA